MQCFYAPNFEKSWRGIIAFGSCVGALVPGFVTFFVPAIIFEKIARYG